ncbi:pentatricopeptide repeat-containing protein At4g08210-like [Wolffia australiana]
MELWPALGDLAAVAGALRRCGRCRAADRGGALHGLLSKKGLLFNNTFLCNALIAMYGDLGSFSNAQALFDEMPHRNVASWTSSIAIHNASGNPFKALRAFSSMLSSSTPNPFTFSAALKAAAMAGDLRLGRQLHAHLLPLNLLLSDAPLLNSLLSLYLSCKLFREARTLFDEIPSPEISSYNVLISGYFSSDRTREAEAVFFDIARPDAVSFNAIISGFAKKGMNFKALEWFQSMNRRGFSIDQFTFPCVLKVCCGLGDARTGRQVHGRMIKSGIRSSFCGSSLIFMYSACVGIEEAEKCFEEFADLKDSLAIANAMVSGLVLNGHSSSGLRLVSRLHRRGFVLDEHTLSAAAMACAGTRDGRSGRQIHGLIVASGLLADPATATAVVKIYARSDGLEAAVAAFDRIPCRDAIAWGALIEAAVEQGSNELGFAILKKMMKEKSQFEEPASPDEFILSRLLSSCAAAADLEGGRQLHCGCVKLGFAGEEATATSLVDMYAKSGDVDAAIAVFRAADCAETAAWTAVIGGCAVNGRSREALGFLREMEEAGVEMNGRTITGALAACRHGGLLREACAIFGAAAGAAAAAEHHHQMADILCRAGRARDACRVLEVEDDATSDVLVGGVGALSTWQDGRCATSDHVTVSNGLARLGRWDELARVREAARRTGARKEPGVSWIEIKT